MIRTMTVLSVISVGMMRAELVSDLPHDLQIKIEELQLRDIKIVYEPRAQCVCITGLNRANQRIAGISMRYIGGGSKFQWTPVVTVLLDERNDRFKIDEFSSHRVFLQWNSAVGFASMTGFYIEFDRLRAVIMLYRIPLAELIELMR